MWSPVEKTALAEAEIEYEDIVSTQIDVAFEIVESPIPELVGAYAVVWTTTPWTIPVNQGIAYGPDIDYVMFYDPGTNDKILVAKDLALALDERSRASEKEGRWPYITASWDEGDALTIKGLSMAMNHCGVQR